MHVVIWTNHQRRRETNTRRGGMKNGYCNTYLDFPAEQKKSFPLQSSQLYKAEQSKQRCKCFKGLTLSGNRIMGCFST